MRSQSARKPRHRNLEIEVKLEVRNLDKLRQKVMELGFEEKVPRTFEDNWFFDYPDKCLLGGGHLLRLRDFDGKALLTYKGPSSRSRHYKIREELETVVEAGPVLREILKRLGLAVSFHFQKYRTIFEHRKKRGRSKVTLVLDETPIGNYIEIEGSPSSIDRVASDLGFGREDFITESYVSLFLKRENQEETREMVFSTRERTP